MSAPLALDLETPVRDGFTTVRHLRPEAARLPDHPASSATSSPRSSPSSSTRCLERPASTAPSRAAASRRPWPRARTTPATSSPSSSSSRSSSRSCPPPSARSGIEALQEPLAAFIALIPQIIVAIVLVVVGAVIAGTVKSFIQNTLGGLSYGNGPGQRRQHPDPARLREVRARPGRHRHHRHRPAALRDPRHRRRCDHRRCRRWPHQADAGPLGDHAEQGRDESANVKAAGPAPRSATSQRLPDRADAYPGEPRHERADRPHRRGGTTTPRRPRTAPARAASRTCTRRSPVPSGAGLLARAVGVGAPGENRTPDALLRTEALCPLSYGGRTGPLAAGSDAVGELHRPAPGAVVLACSQAVSTPASPPGRSTSRPRSSSVGQPSSSSTRSPRSTSADIGPVRRARAARRGPRPALLVAHRHLEHGRGVHEHPSPHRVAVHDRAGERQPAGAGLREPQVPGLVHVSSSVSCAGTTPR